MVQRIKAVFGEVFQIDAANLPSTASPADVEGWDSFGHLALVEALQNEFRVRFEVEDIARMDNLVAIEQVLVSRGALP
jgi:acyl carrier protein